MRWSVDATNCRGQGDCQSGEVCLTHYLWEDLSEQIHAFLSDITLERLTDNSHVKSICERQNSKSDSSLPPESLIKTSLLS